MGHVTIAKLGAERPLMSGGFRSAVSIRSPPSIGAVTVMNSAFRSPASTEIWTFCWPTIPGVAGLNPDEWIEIQTVELDKRGFSHDRAPEGIRASQDERDSLP